MDKNAEKVEEKGKPEELNEKEKVGDNAELSEEGIETSETVDSDELKRAKDELSESKEKYLRLYAEFENFRRRTARERLDLMQMANEDLIVSLLPITDDFERAERALRDKKEGGIEGFALIHNKFRKVLEQYAVREMDIKIGSDFNPDLHEAINQIATSDEKLKGKIVDIVEKGYLIKDKVVRFAKVVVGS